MKRKLLLFLFALIVSWASPAQEREGTFKKGGLTPLPSYSLTVGQDYENLEMLLDFSSPEDIRSWHMENFVSPNGTGLVSTGEGYADRVSYTLESPDFFLPSLSEKDHRLNLYLEEKYALEDNYDQGLVQVSTDAGQSWTTVSSRSGQSDLRTTLINLSAYAGHKVRLALKLHADESVNFGGWLVESLQLRRERVRQSSTLFGAVPSPSATLTGRLSSLDAQKFPKEIFANLSVDRDGVALPNLTEDNFSITETIKDTYDDVRIVVKNDTFKVFPPDTSSVKRPVDILFLMDNSGSMTDEQNAVYNNVEAFVNRLDLLGFDYRLGLCRFGQVLNSGKPIFHDNAAWYNDASTFLNVWKSVNTVDGGIEPSWDALYYSSQQYTFGTGSQKVFILITDESITGNNLPDSDIQDRQQVINRLNEAGVNAYTLVPTGSPFDSDFGAIATATGGRSYDILSPFNDILDDIGDQIGNTYTVRYAPTKSDFDGLKREVKIKVRYRGDELTLNGEYTPGKSPVIMRTGETIDLENRAQEQGKAVTIKVDILDYVQPYTQNASLYYRTVGAGTPYMEMMMTSADSSQQRGRWEATIPGAEVNSPGIEYFIRASDGQSTATAPEFIDRPGYPWSFTVKPNQPPKIVNSTQVTNPAIGDKVVFKAKVYDNTNKVQNVWVYIRRPSDFNYVYYRMRPVGGNLYTYPGVTIEKGLTEYFFIAEDDYGLRSFAGTALNPYTISFSPWNPNIGSPVQHTMNLSGIDLSPGGVEIVNFNFWSTKVKVGGKDIEVGDFIGVFYTDDYGIEQCGGFFKWKGQPTNFVKFKVYGDDPSTPEKDGFASGEAFTFKVYSKRFEKEFDASHILRYSSRDFTFRDRGETDVQSIFSYYHQVSTLKKGQNLWSTYLEPRSKNFDAIFAPYQNLIRLVRDDKGNEWKPGNTGNNTLKVYRPGRGYEVYMKRERKNLLVKGAWLKASQVRVALKGNRRPTLIGCPYHKAENVEAVFKNNAYDIYAVDKYINDGSGNIIIETYSPRYDLNGWTDKNMRPGQAYYVHALNPDPNFTFPKAKGAYKVSKGKVQKNAQTIPQSVKSVEKYMKVIVPEGSWSAVLGAKDELRAYDSKGTLIGRATASNTGSVLIIDGWGQEEGSSIELRLWSSVTRLESSLKIGEWLMGDERYADHKLAVAGAVESYQETASEGLSVYPNPVKDFLNVRFESESGTKVEMSLTDVQGSVLLSSELTAKKGDNTAVLDTSHLKKGTYLLQVKQEGRVRTVKVQVK